MNIAEGCRRLWICRRWWAGEALRVAGWNDHDHDDDDDDDDEDADDDDDVDDDDDDDI